MAANPCAQTDHHLSPPQAALSEPIVDLALFGVHEHVIGVRNRGEDGRRILVTAFGLGAISFGFCRLL